MAIRPSFKKAWDRFSEVAVSVPALGKKIGGKVEANIADGTFTNGCAIRMSYVLNYNNVPIPKGGKYATVSGADGKRYMFRVREMMSFLGDVFGAADFKKTSPHVADFSGKKGILTFDVEGWSDATGHATLFDGTICSDHCYFTEDLAAPVTAKLGKIWILK